MTFNARYPAAFGWGLFSNSCIFDGDVSLKKTSDDCFIGTVIRREGTGSGWIGLPSVAWFCTSRASAHHPKGDLNEGLSIGFWHLDSFFWGLEDVWLTFASVRYI